MLFTKRYVVGLTFAAAIVTFGTNAYAQVAGEWTKCIGRTPNKQWNIVNGQDSEKRCFELGKKCVNDPGYKIEYHSSPVIINAPYVRCTES